MRRVISLLALTILLVHLAGIYLFTLVRMSEIRMEQRLKLASLPANKLDVLQIPASQFQASWMEEREMEWRGKMYDIARVSRAGAIVTVYALHDADEDNLLAFLSAVVKTVNQDTQPAPQSVVQYFSLKFITPTVFNPLPTQLEGVAANPVFHLAIPNVVLDPAFPPPRG